MLDFKSAGLAGPVCHMLEYTALQETQGKINLIFFYIPVW
jgi:hypothetical protein